ncbi:hypothetical protein PHMEG_00010599, partial [Phytophthora megakarya]
MRRIRKPEYCLENKHAAFAYCTKCKRSIRFKIKNSGIEPHMRKYHEEDLKNFGKDDNTTANRIGRALEPEFANVDSIAKTHMLRNIPLSSKLRYEGPIKFVKFITEEICGVKLHLPGRTRLRADIITLVGDLRVEVKADIARSCVYYSITSDIWTTRNSHSYIAFTIHYVNEEFEFVSWALEVKEIPGKHDGTAIVAALNMILDDWGLSKDLCTHVVRDPGSNMISAGNIWGTDHAA